MNQDDSHQLVVLPSHVARVAGILKYMRESADHELVFDTEVESPTGYQIKCEYCGKAVSPSLDEICVYGLKDELLFCCEQWKQQYRLLLNMRNVSEEKSEDILSEDDNSATTELVCRRKDTGLSIFLMDSKNEDKSEPRLFEDYLIEKPVLDNVVPGSNARIVRLSCLPEGSCVKLPDNESKRRAHFLGANFSQIEFSVSICDHKPLNFGLCHYQEGRGSVTKYYTDGLKFLSVLDDGSAQVFYPSGLLAILVIVTKAHGRVCIVYDDVPGQPMRALFQSDGRGTCYHTNGNIWLIVDKYGGKCLDPEGARVRRWTWHKLGITVKPIFLFINKSIGVRILRQQQVFVSFLANSRQAKFNVGACCQKGNCKDVETPSKFAREELLALAFRIKTTLLIQKINRFMSTPSHPFLPNAALSPRLKLLAQTLLKAGEKFQMSEDDSNFLQSCLEEFIRVQQH